MGKRMSFFLDPGRALPFLGPALFLAALALGAESKFSLSPYLDYNYSSNVFWNVNQVADHEFSPGLELGFSSGDLELFLTADGRFYQENNGLNAILLAGGVNWIKVFSPRMSLFVSPDFMLARYSGDLAFLDTHAPGLVLGLKQVLSKRLSGRLGLSARYTDYLREDSYDRARLGLFAELSAFLPSQTTLRLASGMSYLRFPHIALGDAADGGDPPGAGPGDPRGGHYRPPGPAAGASGSSAVILRISQPYAVARIAQGLGYKTGVFAELMLRRNLNPLQGIQALAASEWALEQTDDDFFWEGSRLWLGMKTEAVLGLDIALDLFLVRKTYGGIEALDLDGVPVQPLATRADTLAQAALRVRKRFGRLDLSAAAAFRRNRSNDLYFRYDFLTISAGMQFSL